MKSESAGLMRFFQNQSIHGAPQKIPDELARLAVDVGIISDLTRIDELREFILSQTLETLDFQDFLIRFLTSYISSVEHSSILDCYSANGEVFTRIMKKVDSKRSVGVLQSEDNFRFTKLLSQSSEINWKIGEPLRIIREDNEKYDIVLGLPPFGLRLKDHHCCPKDIMSITRDYGEALLLESIDRIKPSGIGIFLLPEKFMFSGSKEKINEHLSQRGFFIEVAAYIPGSFWKETSINSILVIINNQQWGDLFICEIPKEEGLQSVLIENILNHRQDINPRLGFLTNPTRLISIKAEFSQQEYLRSIRDTDLKVLRFSDFAEITLYKSEEHSQDEEPDDYLVFLPLEGTSPASTAPLEAKTNPKGYYCLKCNCEYIISDYLSLFLNSETGIRIREGMMSSLGRRIPMKILENWMVGLPSIEKQEEILQLQSAILDISTELKDMSRSLWSFSTDLKAIHSRAFSIKRPDDLKLWIETLPFPLGSILWRYVSEIDFSIKNRLLYSFFTALAELNAVLIMSALCSDINFFEQQIRPTIKSWKIQPLSWIGTATLANWAFFGRDLAKIIRDYKEGNDEASRGRWEQCRMLFGNPPDVLFDTLLSKSVYDLLFSVKKPRNDWDAHGPVYSLEFERKHFVQLEFKLHKYRELIGDNWLSVQMLSPISSKLSSGIYHQTALSLVGARFPFEKVEVVTACEMDDKYLWMLPIGQKRPLKILPFIRFINDENKKIQAIYFYNRCDEYNGEIKLDSETRWVSYYFTEVPEYTLPIDSELAEVIRFIKGSKK